MNRRQFLLSAGAAGYLSAGPFSRAVAAVRNKVKITDVKCMIVRGTWDWNLIKIETDSGPVRHRRGLLGLGRQGPGAQ